MIISLFRDLIHELTAAFNPGEWIAVAKQLRKTNRRTILTAVQRILPQFLIYYIVLSPIIAAPLYNLMLFHPTMSGPFGAHKILGTDIQNEFFCSKNGARLHAWYLQAPHSKCVVLISHGNGGNLTNRIPLIAMFLRCGISIFIYDYEGYGRSAGSPSVDKICEDGSAAYDYLLGQKGYRGENIVVFGESLGSGVACQLAEQRPVAGIILQSAFSSLRDLAQQKILWLRLYPACLFPKQQLNNADILRQPHSPLLLVHGKRDRLIPVAHSEEIYHVASQPKAFAELPDAGHNDIYDTNFEQYRSAVQQFLLGLPCK
jgi:fermentation-respiration switch protein FrsA (DUF1100 family)